GVMRIPFETIHLSSPSERAWTRARVKPGAGGLRLAPPSVGSTPGAPWQETQWGLNSASPAATASGERARGVATFGAWGSIERVSAKGAHFSPRPARAFARAKRARPRA